jgi:hypothetical protein
MFTHLSDRAFKALVAGRKIDFDFDYELNCFDRTTQKSILGGIVYRARTGKLEGTWKWP